MASRSIAPAKSEALPSLEKAKALLAQARRASEVRKIRAIAQAVASVERGKEIAIDAGEIVLLADARLGELTREVEAEPPNKTGARGGRGKKGVSARNTLSRSARLEAEGVTRKRAAECEKIAALKDSGDLDKYVAAEREAGRVPSVGSAVTLAKLPEPDRKRVLGKLGDKPDVRQAINEVKLEAKRSLAAEIRERPVVTPDGRYQVIAIDPPWKYDSRANDTTHRGKNLYPDMSVDEVCSLPVSSLAQEDCVLWLWTTNAFMRAAFACLDAWGFTEKTILTWDKVNMGLGDWLRNVTEHCILAVRGSPVIQLSAETTLIREVRREHSRKPEAFYQLVESLCPGSKLEMFARETRAGWAGWGAEATKFDSGNAA